MVATGIAEVGSSAASELSGIKSLSTLHDAPRSFRHRQVDELTVLSPGRGATGLLECRQHPSRPGQLFGRGGENLVDDRQLARVYCRLAEQTQAARRLGFSPQAAVVFQQRMYAVAGRWLAGRAGGGHQVRAGEQRLLVTGGDP